MKLSEAVRNGFYAGIGAAIVEAIEKLENENTELHKLLDLFRPAPQKIDTIDRLIQENTELHRKLNLIHDKTLALDLVLSQLKNKLEVL